MGTVGAALLSATILVGCPQFLTDLFFGPADTDLVNIVIDQGPQSLLVGEQVAVTATGTDGAGTTRAITTEVHWASSDPTIIDVNAGQLAALAGGQVIITATHEGVVGGAAVTGLEGEGSTLMPVSFSVGEPVAAVVGAFGKSYYRVDDIATQLETLEIISSTGNFRVTAYADPSYQVGEFYTSTDPAPAMLPWPTTGSFYITIDELGGLVESFTLEVT